MNPLVKGILDIPEDLYRHIFSFILEGRGRSRGKEIIPLSAIPFIAFSDNLKKLCYVTLIRWRAPT